jgi:hypothetical protein
VQPDNPLADYTFSLVPCRTRKRALGDATRDYMPDLRVQHYGFVNGTAALDHLPVASAGKSAMMTAISSKWAEALPAKRIGRSSDNDRRQCAARWATYPGSADRRCSRQQADSLPVEGGARASNRSSRLRPRRVLHDERRMPDPAQIRVSENRARISRAAASAIAGSGALPNARRCRWVRSSHRGAAPEPTTCAARSPLASIRRLRIAPIRARGRVS